MVICTLVNSTLFNGMPGVYSCAIAVSFITVLTLTAAGLIFSDYSGLSGEIDRYRKNDEGLRSMSRRYLSMINAIGDLILVTDDAGYILFANNSAREFLGCEPEECVGNHIALYIYGDTVTAREGEQPCGGGFSPFYFENREFSLRKKGGARVWVQSRCRPYLDGDGSPAGHIITIGNITEIMEKEHQLFLAKESAERANRAKSIFLANMSHELRTPLSSILGYSQFLQMQEMGPVNEKQMQYLQYIIQSGDHLLEMVNDILDLSKVESGKYTIDKKPFDINRMLARSPSTIKAVADRKRVEMELAIEENIGTVLADEVRVKQVIYNLLANAIKFTEPGKKIGIEARSDGDRAVITVWDQGCGIPACDLERIFEPFEQTENGRKEHGTGLGLSISRKLVELHGGTLTVKSVVGEGSRFTVALPGRIAVETAESLAEMEYLTAVVPGEKKRVVLIEDDNMVSELIGSILDTAGCEVIRYESGESILSHDGQGIECDLVLVDIRLPGINGTETMKKLREKFRENVPFVAITGYAMKGDREKFLEEGFDDYVSKPFKIESFLSMVNGTVH